MRDMDDNDPAFNPARKGAPEIASDLAPDAALAADRVKSFQLFRILKP
jgi:hypothetical protein